LNERTFIKGRFGSLLAKKVRKAAANQEIRQIARVYEKGVPSSVSAAGDTLWHIDSNESEWCDSPVKSETLSFQ